MATVTQTQREVGYFLEREPRSVLGFSTREVAQLGDTATFVPRANVREVAQLNDAFVESAAPRLRDAAQLADLATGAVRTGRTVREAAVALGAAIDAARVPVTVREVAEFVDRAVTKVGTNVTDLGTLSDLVTPKAYAVRVVREQAKAVDRAFSAPSGSLREVATLNDAVALKTYSRPVFREVAEFVDRIDGDVRQAAVLREQAVVIDRTSAVHTLRGSFREVVYVADSPVPPAYGRAYTCSVASWGMSTFSNYPFLTMAGNYAAGENLWRLDADDDYGTPIASHITSGVMDMGAGQMKRPSAVYISGSSSDPLTIKVAGDVNGVKEEYEYPVELRDQTDYRNNRALIGKGFRSRFIQVKIEGNGANYRLLSADLDVAVTPRRL